MIWHYIKATKFFPEYCPEIKDWKKKMTGISGNGKPKSFTPDEHKKIQQGLTKLLKTLTMKKLLLTITVAALTVSCITTRPAITDGKLTDGNKSYQIQYGPTGRAYVVKDGKRKNLYRYPQTVKK